MFVNLQSPPLDVQLKILMNVDIDFNKGWKYEPKKKIIITNLHNEMFLNNDD